METGDLLGEHLGRVPVVGIFRGYSPQRTVELCQHAWEFGVELIEVPVQDPAALPALQAAIAAGREAGKVVGAGTVVDTDQLETVHRLGAAFTVAPGLNPAVITRSHELRMTHLPGVATSTEIATAVALDLRWLKAFPAAQLGAEWIAAQLAPFPDVRFVATGGIDADNAAQFLQAGARAVAIGAALGDPGMLDRLGAVFA